MSVTIESTTGHGANFGNLQLFEQLKQKAGEKEMEKRSKELNARLQAQVEKQSQRLAVLVKHLPFMSGGSRLTSRSYPQITPLLSQYLKFAYYQHPKPEHHSLSAYVNHCLALNEMDLTLYWRLGRKLTRLLLNFRNSVWVV
jgi:hypothetical protein